MLECIQLLGYKGIESNKLNLTKIRVLPYEFKGEERGPQE